MILAGHGKDSRLVQVELPVAVPNVGDRIREDCNNKDLVEVAKPVLVEVVAKEILLPFDHEIPDKEKSDENYTPDYFVEACRAFLGWFDLDPFSNAIAQKSIRAKTFWAKADNALTKDWTPYEKKIVNPPYSQGLIGKCIDKILEFCAIGETILIVNSSTSAKWFQRCKDASSAYLNPSKRLPFYNPYREIQYLNGTKKRSGNEYDQTVFYFGDRPLEFAKAMEHLGSCSIPIKKSSCLPTSTISEALEPLVSPVETLEKSRPSPMLIPAETRKKSTKRTSLKSRSIPTSEITIPKKELTSSLAASPAQEPVLQEIKQDLTTPNLQCGLSISDVSEKDSPSLSLSRTPQDYSIAEWEQSYKAYPRAATMRSGRLSQLQCLEVPKNVNGCLSLPTLTTGLGSGRNAGATRSEKWLKDRLLLQSTQALNPQMMALLFAFPMDWTECLLEFPRESEGAMMLENSLDEQLTLTVQQSPLSESCTYTEFSANNIDASSSGRLQFLLEQRDRLINSGASPQGVWICCSRCHDRDFRQAVWKSDKPQPQWGGKKSQYIGRQQGDEHLSAIAQHKAGQELRKIEREIRKLQVKS